MWSKVDLDEATAIGAKVIADRIQARAHYHETYVGSGDENDDEEVAAVGDAPPPLAAVGNAPPQVAAVCADSSMYGLPPVAFGTVDTQGPAAVGSARSKPFPHQELQPKHVNRFTAITAIEKSEEMTGAKLPSHWRATKGANPCSR